MYSSWNSFIEIPNRHVLTGTLHDKELKYWTKSPNKFLVSIAKESGKILGCASYEEMTPTTVTLCCLSVDKDFRGLKIGTHLVKFILDLAKESGYDTMYLETSEPQKAGQKLYKKLGFKHLHSEPTWLLNPFGLNFEYLCGFTEMAFVKRIQ